LQYHADGFSTWDLADHYGPAEDFIGLFREALVKKYGESELSNTQAFTKWVPRPTEMPFHKAAAAIELSKRRMRVKSLDMLQFHWWDYHDEAYLDAMKHLADLQAQGGIKHLALTNFDTEHTAKIIDSGIKLVSNQVQYSIIDRRPQVQMTDYYQQEGLYLLSYGTLAGGLLTDRYLNQAEPTQSQLITVSLRKYKNMIDAWGGWTLFQRLLHTLRHIADKHTVSIANVALRYVLQQPMVAGVIAGARLGLSDNRDDNRRVFTFSLDSDDFAAIDDVCEASKDLFQLIGDCGDEYRNRS
jgi:aryl-alcohol dehydrogenase-like predicted oxidoreductase